MLEEQLATLTKMFEDLSVRVTEAETQRDEAVVTETFFFFFRFHLDENKKLKHM